MNNTETKTEKLNRIVAEINFWAHVCLIPTVLLGMGYIYTFKKTPTDIWIHVVLWGVLIATVGEIYVRFRNIKREKSNLQK